MFQRLVYRCELTTTSRSSNVQQAELRCLKTPSLQTCRLGLLPETSLYGSPKSVPDERRLLKRSHLPTSTQSD